jgi:hypothetical protein
VDEGNNWINLRWGPLSLSNPDPTKGGILLDARLNTGSPAEDYIASTGASQTYYNAAPSDDYFGHARKIGGNAVDAGAIEQSSPLPPHLDSITPNVGSRGAVVNVTLSGTSLTNVTAVNINGTGVAVSNVHVVNDTTVTATFSIAGNANTSARNVSVTSAGMTSNNVTFTVQVAPAPVITSISPTYGYRNTAVPVTVTGSHFTGATALTISGSGVTVSNFVVSNDTTITAILHIGNVGTSNRNVRVVGGNGAGTSNAVTFTTEGIPAITSVAPNTGVRGTNVNVTLTGTGFTGATAITISGGQMTISNLQVVSDTQATATVGIGATATTGNHQIRITTPGGISPAVNNFTVQGPTVASIGPNPVVRPASGTTVVTLTFTGTNLASTTSITNLFTGGFTMVAGSLTATNTTVTVQMNVPFNASTTTRQPFLVTGIGNTTPVALNVQ